MKTYLKEKWRPLLTGLGCLIFINFYFGFLCSSRVYPADLFYLDLILLLAGSLTALPDFLKWKRLDAAGKQDNLPLKEEEMEKLLGHPVHEIWKRKEHFWKSEKEEVTEEILELTDYISKWAHEVKLPLASLRLMNERNPDTLLQRDMQERLEHMQALLNTMLMSCKLKALENDCRYEKLVLQEAVRESLRNQSYFLIKEEFEIDIDLMELSVYTDRRWLVYMLDQIIGNAVKYRKTHPKLTFGAKKLSDEEVVFWIEDNGIGIPADELPFIWGRGFIGSNLRDGDYRSTGMGLYFTKKTAERMHIGLDASSKEGSYTRFTFHFQNNAIHFNR